MSSKKRRNNPSASPRTAHNAARHSAARRTAFCLQLPAEKLRAAITRVRSLLSVRRNRIIAAAAGSAVVFAAAAGIAAAVWRASVLSVAFYQVPEAVISEVTVLLQKTIPKKIKADILNPEKELTRRTAASHDLLITWQGAPLATTAAAAVIPEDRIYSLLPTPLRAAGAAVRQDGARYTVPLLLDHFELAYYRTLRKEVNAEIPATLQELESYLQSIQPSIDTPLFCAGADDRTLLGLVSVLYESMYGSAKYRNLIARLSDGAAGGTGTADARITALAPVIQKLRQWQQDRLIHPKWYKATERDVNTFIKDRRPGVLFMTLSEHRTKSLLHIKYFDASRFPAQEGSPAEHALIAPAVTATAYNEKKDTLAALEQLLLSDAQSSLSTQSRLAPASSRAQSHDLQADDVRYWAASCAGGAVPDLGLAACTTAAALHELAERIRIELEQEQSQ